LFTGKKREFSTIRAREMGAAIDRRVVAWLTAADQDLDPLLRRRLKR
jgi:hypothetical protein